MTRMIANVNDTSTVDRTAIFAIASVLGELHIEYCNEVPFMVLIRSTFLLLFSVFLSTSPSFSSFVYHAFSMIINLSLILVLLLLNFPFTVILCIKNHRYFCNFN